MERLCTICRRSLPVDAFYAGGRNACKECRKKAVEARRQRIKSEGKCIECRSPVEGGTLCVSCQQVHRDRHHANKERYNSKSRERRRGLKLDAFNAYGGPVCACCGEVHLEFLSIDHIYGDGAEHRRDLLEERGWKGGSSQMTGAHAYLWLKKNGYPPGFRVLCMNCNFAIGHFGYCPHTSTMTVSEDV